MNKDDVVIFGLTASKKFSENICKKLGVKEGEIDVSRFADGELNIRLKTSVRGKEVYVIQSTSPQVNENIMELLVTIDLLVRASAAKIHAVIPYFGYARQDRKMGGRQPITCKLVANLLTKAGINRLMTVELHSPQEQGFFDIPVDDLKVTHDLALYVANKDLKNLVVVSPDHGGVTRARRLADFLGCPLAVVDKRRSKPNQSEVQFVLGDVKDKDVIIIDDLIDTGGTIINASRAIKDKGAKDITVIATHGLFSADAPEKFNKANEEGLIKEVIITDTIELEHLKTIKNLKVVSVTDFLSEMIKASVECTPLTEVYNNKTESLLKNLKKG